MKRSSCLVLALAIAVLGASPTLADSPRVVLVESFTSWTCGPCASANPVTHQVMQDFQEVIAVNVQYHMNWPAPGTDGFYAANPTENGARRSYYGISAVPDLVFDGANVGSPGSPGSMDAEIRGNLTVAPGFDLAVNSTLLGDQLTVDVDATALEDYSSSNLRLRIAIVEPEINYGSPPGTNGETDFYNTMRRMLPDATGTSLAPTTGQTLSFSETVTVDPSWKAVFAVVWVQDEVTKQVLQTATTRPVDNAFFFGAETTAAIGDWNVLSSLETTLRNYGKSADTYDVHIEKNIPPAWSGSVCHEETCFAPFVTDFTVTLDPGQSDRIYCDILPTTGLGTGLFTLTATSQADPTQSISKGFKLISPGVPILHVDHDGGYDYEGYTEQALIDGGYTYANWDIAIDGRAEVLDWTKFRTIVWNVGLQYPTLIPKDTNRLEHFLNNGGNLFIHGQDLGWDLDSSQGTGGTRARTFYRDYLLADYILDDTNDLSITGVPGDPIFDGVSISIGGGDGANNQTYPDEIQPRTGAVGCMEYAPNREAALSVDNGTYKVVYLAFGFEGISNQSDRALVMQRVMDWFGPGATPVPETPDALASRFAVDPTAQPNPFNPTTEIRFELAGAGEVDLEIGIYDLRGRRLRTLVDGPTKAGLQRFDWDGRDDHGSEIASGTYVARVLASGEERSLKLSLVK